MENECSWMNFMHDDVGIHDIKLHPLQMENGCLWMNFIYDDVDNDDGIYP
jgi:hypothetical protein